ncbi:type IV pilin protein [Vibrio sp. YMD68]|uniref:type IV pilin protein n=1 Tax=Vibrio sp. YMD68 TaxID=3042300 RepID=UPI00249BE8C5|nr:type IV pilin protein [Vibrio sp. YMD68]WGW01043.1 type IV pilin protein [Vibrio sp. YMD68]
MIRIISCNLYKNRQVGMTLIELLFTVAIIAILSAIAYPSYTSHVIEAHRTAAKMDMMRIQLLLEEGYVGTYSWSSIISAGTCTVCESSGERYLFSVVSSSTSTYTITATAQTDKGQTNDACLSSDHKMTLNAKGETAPSDCW